MKVVGLITEYNPFHNGHKYHLDEAKRITGADYVVIVMSGNFVQRGIPAMMDKYSRAKMALVNGGDLVFELPVCYATASAEYFAQGSVALLNSLGIVDYICFGSECGDITLLKETARLFINDNKFFDEQLLSFLKDGFTYPAARTKALLQYLKTSDCPDKKSNLQKILTEPNNILGIEYMKALYHLSSEIIPVTIQRKTAHYHDSELTDRDTLYEVEPTPCPVISSATAIRRSVLHVSTPDIASAKNSVPEDVYEFLLSNYKKTYPITEEDFASIIKYKLSYEDKPSLSGYVDISADLADRLLNLKNLDLTVEELTKHIKTKNMTLTRISRALIHLLLNIHTEDFMNFNRRGYALYARVLGMKKEASHLLKKINDIGQIPVITKVSKAYDQLDALGMKMLSQDLFAAHIYNQAVFEKYKTSIPDEYHHGISFL